MVCPYNKTSYPASRRAPTRSSSYLGGESGVYNTFDKAEFVLRKPVQVAESGDESIRTTDYSQVRVVPARHEIYCEVLD